MVYEYCRECLLEENQILFEESRVWFEFLEEFDFVEEQVALIHRFFRFEYFDLFNPLFMKLF